MIYNMEEKPENIVGIEVVDNMKYLGVEICNNREIFKGQRERIVQQINKMASMSYSVIIRSCNRILIGKI